MRHFKKTGHCKACSSGRGESLAGLLAACRKTGLRRTRLLQRLLESLHRHDQPVNIQEFLAEPGIAGVCNTATLYRLLQRLEARGIVRRIGLHERAAHFTLHRDHHHDYVVCRECGGVELLGMKCPVEPLERKVGRLTGFREVYHELQFYGVCPKCVTRK